MISIIAAMDEKRGIGKNNKLLFRIPEDMRRFRELTTGHPVIMGRKTYESIGRPLPNRTSIIITHNASFARSHLTNMHIAGSLEEAIEIAKKSEGADEIFVIGGGQIYQQAINQVDKLYLTIVEGAYDADTFFPEYESKGFKIVKEEKGEENGYMFRFVYLEK